MQILVIVTKNLNHGDGYYGHAAGRAEAGHLVEGAGDGAGPGWEPDQSQASVGL